MSRDLFVLRRDEDGHWHLIPEYRAQEFDEWVDDGSLGKDWFRFKDYMLGTGPESLVIEYPVSFG